jgi:hypothetical protein
VLGRARLVNPIAANGFARQAEMLGEHRIIQITLVGQCWKQLCVGGFPDLTLWLKAQ